MGDVLLLAGHIEAPKSHKLCVDRLSLSFVRQQIDVGRTIMDNNQPLSSSCSHGSKPAMHNIYIYCYPMWLVLGWRTYV